MLPEAGSPSRGLGGGGGNASLRLGGLEKHVSHHSVQASGDRDGTEPAFPVCCLIAPFLDSVVKIRTQKLLQPPASRRDAVPTPPWG